MSSTFTTPIRVFKRNNPTNDGTIAPDNTGAARLSQQQYVTNPIAATTTDPVVFTTADIGTTNTVPFVVPAGSIIEAISLYQDTAAGSLVGGVITVAIAITNPTTLAVTTTTIGTITPTAAGGRIAGVFTATAAVATILKNIGPLDATLTFTAAAVTTLASGAVGGVFSVDYTARNADGSIIAYGSGYTNN
jgi:hypothetical protein